MTIVNSTFVHATFVHATFVLEMIVLYFKFLQKSAVRLSFPPFSWGKGMPLIGQAAQGRMAGIIVLTAWPIRDNENGGKLTLAPLFSRFSILMPPQTILNSFQLQW